MNLRRVAILCGPVVSLLVAQMASRGQTPPARAARGRKGEAVPDPFDFGPLFSDPAEEDK